MNVVKDWLTKADRRTTELLDQALARRTVSDDQVTLTGAELAECRSAATTLIAGFRVFNDVEYRRQIGLKQQAVANSRSLEAARFEAPQKRREWLTARVREAGVTPIAVVPVTMLKDMCRQCGVFWLDPDNQGRVGMGVRAEDVDNMFGRPVLTMWERLLGVPETSLEERLKDRFDRMSHTQTLQTLFPDNHFGHHGRIKVELPAPPPEVVEILQRMHSSPRPYIGRAYDRMEVIVAPEALRLMELPHKRLVSAQQAEALATVRPSNADPIVLFSNRHVCPDFVAVLAQFGSFPAERMLLDLVLARMNEESLLQRL